MPQKSAKQPSKKALAKPKSTSKKKSKGLGDSIEKFTEATGIKKVVEAIAGEDCGCEQRKETLNQQFKYYKTMTIEQAAVWESLQKPIQTKVLNRVLAEELINLYNELHLFKKRVTRCPSCFKPVINKLTKIYEDTCQENKKQ